MELRVDCRARIFDFRPRWRAVAVGVPILVARGCRAHAGGTDGLDGLVNSSSSPQAVPSESLTRVINTGHVPIILSRGRLRTDRIYHEVFICTVSASASRGARRSQSRVR